MEFVWEITEEQKIESQENFFALTNGDSLLSALVVRDNFVNILPATDLSEIWYCNLSKWNKCLVEY